MSGTTEYVACHKIFMEMENFNKYPRVLAVDKKEKQTKNTLLKQMNRIISDFELFKD